MIVGVLNSISTVLLFLAKLAIAAATSAVGYGLAKTGYLISENNDPPIYSPLMIGVITFIIGFIIASLFMSLLETAIDTVLQCFVIDYEMCTNDPSKSKFIQNITHL